MNPIKTRACLPSVCEVAEQQRKALVFQNCGRIRKGRQAGKKAHKKGKMIGKEIEDAGGPYGLRLPCSAAGGADGSV